MLNEAPGTPEGKGKDGIASLSFSSPFSLLLLPPCPFRSCSSACYDGKSLGLRDRGFQERLARLDVEKGSVMLRWKPRDTGSVAG